MTSRTSPVWPPPAHSVLPEPLLSHLHALVLPRNRTVHVGPPTDRDLTGRPTWHRTLRAQLREAAADGSNLRRDLAAHLSPYQLWGETENDRVDSAVRKLVSHMCLFVERPEVPRGDDENELWLREWSRQTPREDWRAMPPVTGVDLLPLRLAMADLDAVQEVLGASGGARLRSFVTHERWPTDKRCLTLDTERLAVAFPELDPVELQDAVGRALCRRHVIGLLDRQDLTELGLEPVDDHPCGFDTAYRESNVELVDLCRAITGRDGTDRVVLEWTRHQWLSWGEDEDLMFFVPELPGLRASLDDPWNVKAGEVMAQIDKILSHNPERAAELKQYRYRPALDELFDTWRYPEHFHVDAAMSLDNALRQLAHQDLLPELSEVLDRIVARSHDDESARRALGGAIDGVVVADGPDGCYRSLAVALRERVHELSAGLRAWPPASPLFEFPRCQRTSSFSDDGVDARAREALVERHDTMVTEFLAGTTGWDHLVLYGDLGEDVGVVGSVVVGDEPAFSTMRSTSGAVVETTCVIMVLARVGGEVGVEAVYPELPLDPELRAAYPALCQFFATAFHRGSAAPVRSVARVMRELREPAWSAVRDELDLLLHEDDEVELRRVVEHCGSYIVPQQTRHWVRCLRRRFDEFDWRPDRDGPL